MAKKPQDTQGVRPIKKGSMKGKGAGRPPIAEENEPTRDFTVAPGFIIGALDGSGRLKGGDTITLTKAQATHYMKMGAIEVDLPDFEPQKETVDGPNTPKEAADDGGSQPEAGAGPQADGGGDAPVGGDGAGDNAPTPDKGKGGGKKPSL